MSGAAAAGGAPAAQPLPSSVINKQPMTADAQYMQQQSHIFVFSTQLANKAYEAVVLQSQFPTIIAYHCSQPGTKKYLDVSTALSYGGGKEDKVWRVRVVAASA